MDVAKIDRGRGSTEGRYAMTPNHELLTRLRSKGLLAWQATFAAAFLDPDSSPYHLLAAPPGLGKMYTGVAIAKEMISLGAQRILVLAPAALCVAWAHRLALQELEVFSLTRAELREIEATCKPHESPFQRNGVYVMSQDLAKQKDVADSLSVVNWNAVIIDDAHRMASPQRLHLLQRLIPGNARRRLLLLTATPLPSLSPLMEPASEQFIPLATTNWYGVITNWDGTVVRPPGFTWKILIYKRSEDEMRVVGRFIESIKQLEVASGGNKLLTRVLKHRLSSSLFAFETTLQRLGNRLTLSIEHSDESMVGGESERIDEPITWTRNEPLVDVGIAWINRPAALGIINSNLQALETIKGEEKLQSLRTILKECYDRVDEPKICIFSVYRDTLTYLQTAIRDWGLQSWAITGGTTLATREERIRNFKNQGGVLLTTDVGVSEGITMPDVNSVIHFDLPLTSTRLNERLGPFLRFDRKVELTFYVIRDDSGVFPEEEKLIDVMTSYTGPFTGYEPVNFEF
jgi:superfamily II DNA or RNA helicase